MRYKDIIEKAVSIINNKEIDIAFDYKLGTTIEWVKMNHRNEIIDGIDINKLDEKIKSFIKTSVLEIIKSLN